MRAASGRIGVTDRAAPLWERRGSILGKPRPDARDPATCAGLNCANPTAPANDRECHGRGGSFLPLMRGMRAMMDACIHIEPGRSPVLPTRTGLLNAQAPTSVTSWWGLFYARPVARLPGRQSPRGQRRSPLWVIALVNGSLRDAGGAPERYPEAAASDLIVPLRTRSVDAMSVTDCFSKWLISSDFHPMGSIPMPQIVTRATPINLHVSQKCDIIAVSQKCDTKESSKEV